MSPIQFSVAMYGQHIVKTTLYSNIRGDAISVVGISAQVLYTVQVAKYHSNVM